MIEWVLLYIALVLAAAILEGIATAVHGKCVMGDSMEAVGAMVLITIIILPIIGISVNSIFLSGTIFHAVRRRIQS